MSLGTLALDALATALYEGRLGSGLAVFYDNIKAPRAQQVILFALQHRGANPPVEVLRTLWDKHGLIDPYPFFMAAVFQHTDLWVKIIGDLAAADMWSALSCYMATQPAATNGHLRCSGIYLDALMRCTDSDLALRMAICYVDYANVEAPHMHRMVELMRDGYQTTVLEWFGHLRGKQLIHVADDLLAMDGTDALLMQMVGHEDFAAAVKRSKCTSSVCLLTRPVQELTDDEFRNMVLLYLPQRYTIGLGVCIHWHTDALRRGDGISATRFEPTLEPDDVHYLLHWIALGWDLPYDPHLWMKALRDQPAACTTLGPQLAAALAKHRREMDGDVQRLCLPVPKALSKHIATFV